MSTRFHRPLKLIAIHAVTDIQKISIANRAEGSNRCRCTVARNHSDRWRGRRRLPIRVTGSRQERQGVQCSRIQSKIRQCKSICECQRAVRTTTRTRKKTNLIPISRSIAAPPPLTPDRTSVPVTQCQTGSLGRRRRARVQSG